MSFTTAATPVVAQAVDVSRHMSGPALWASKELGSVTVAGTTHAVRMPTRSTLEELGRHLTYGDALAAVNRRYGQDADFPLTAILHDMSRERFGYAVVELADANGGLIHMPATGLDDTLPTWTPRPAEPALQGLQSLHYPGGKFEFRSLPQQVTDDTLGTTGVMTHGSTAPSASPHGRPARHIASASLPPEVSRMDALDARDDLDTLATINGTRVVHADPDYVERHLAPAVPVVGKNDEAARIVAGKNVGDVRSYIGPGAAPNAVYDAWIGQRTRAIDESVAAVLAVSDSEAHVAMTSAKGKKATHLGRSGGAAYFYEVPPATPVGDSQFAAESAWIGGLDNGHPTLPVRPDVVALVQRDAIRFGPAANEETQAVIRMAMISADPVRAARAALDDATAGLEAAVERHDAARLAAATEADRAAAAGIGSRRSARKSAHDAQVAEKVAAEGVASARERLDNAERDLRASHHAATFVRDPSGVEPRHAVEWRTTRPTDLHGLFAPTRFTPLPRDMGITEALEDLATGRLDTDIAYIYRHPDTGDLWLGKTLSQTSIDARRPTSHHPDLMAMRQGDRILRFDTEPWTANFRFQDSLAPK